MQGLKNHTVIFSAPDYPHTQRVMSPCKLTPYKSIRNIEDEPDSDPESFGETKASPTQLPHVSQENENELDATSPA